MCFPGKSIEEKVGGNELNPLTLHALVAQIADHLEGWSVPNEQIHSHGGHIFGPDGAKIFVRLANGSPARLRITGCYPVANDGRKFDRHADCPVRTASPDRSPESIAGDIGRWVIPPYLALYKDIRRQIEEYEAEQALRLGRAEELRVAMRGIRPSDVPCCVYLPGQTGGRIEVVGSDNIRVDLSGVSFPVALKIAAFLGDNHGTETEE